MKLFALLGLVGLAVVAASSVSPNQLKWQPGYVYHFDYSGRLLTGLPELATHFSGLGIKCKVEVTVAGSSDSGSSGSHKLGLRITEAKYVRVNEQLHGDGSSIDGNWRKIKLPEFHEVPEEKARWMKSPAVFEFTRNTGIFETLTVSHDEPEWSVNFKKALVSILHIRFEEDNLGGNLEHNNRIESDRRESEVRESGSYVDYWKTKEESLDGTCDVTYQINEIPAYMIRELPEKVPYTEGCPTSNSKYYEIVKTRDVSSCSKRSAFAYYKPGFFRCATGGNCAGMWSRSSITRYVTCGSSRDDLRIQSVVNEGELNQNLMGFKAEKFLTGSRQSLHLFKKESNGGGSGGGNVVYPQNPIAIKNLWYEYDMSSRKNTDGLPLVNQESLEESNLLHKKHGHKEQREPSRLIPQIKKLFKEIVDEDLFNHENVGEKQMNMKALSLARAFTVLNKTSISSIYHELKNEFSSEEKKYMFKNVFFDTLLMGGSVADITFVKEQIMSGELSTVQTISFFTFLPQYVLTPTRNLLKSLFELVTSSHIREKPILYNHAIMSFTQLLQKACVADNRLTSYPTYVYGDFCNPDSGIVVNTWIPYLQRELNEAKTPEKKNLIIVTLGLMSHKNVIPALVPYVENSRHHGDETNSHLTRYLAVYSMGVVGRKFPGLVIPLVFSVFSNPAEKTEVRIAAFNVIIRSEPSMTVFHKIAAATWREKNYEVLQVVNTAIYSLSQQEELASMEVTGSSLPRKAYLVYPLIKKTGAGHFPTSASVHSSEYLRELGVGYRKINSWVDGKDQAIPSDIFTRIVYYMDRYQFSPLEIGVRVHNGESLLRQVIELLDPEQSRESAEEFSDKINERLHDEWRHIIKNLRIKNRDNLEQEGGSEDAEGAFFLNFFEDSPMFVSFKSASSEVLREKIGHLLKNPAALRNLARGEDTHLNFQRMFDLAPTEFSIPSDMGFPILVEVHMPVTLSLRGKINADLVNRASPSFKTEFQTIFAAQMTGYVGTVCPFTDEFTLTGVEKHTVLNLPFEFNVDFNVREHKMNFKLKALSSSRNTGHHANLLTFEVRPFTVHQQIWDLKPITLNTNFKIIESGTARRSLVHNFGEYFGFDLKTVVESESHYLDFQTVMQKLKMANYNPLNLLRFGWTYGALTASGHASFRRHKIQVRYDPSASTTKEIEFQLEYGYGSKLMGESETKIHQLEVEERRSEREGLLPYRIARRALNELNSNNLNNEKVRELLEGSRVEYGHAFTVKYTVLLKGGSSRHNRALTYKLNFVRGFEELKEKWDLHLETETGKKLCFNGNMQWPKNTIWNLEDVRSNNFEFRYENVIGFGNDCQEHKIRTEGSTKVSEKQKDVSRLSREARKYEKLMERGAPAVELAEIADKLREQASFLDEVDFVTKYENVPKKYMIVSEYFIQYLKAIWWVNLVPYESSSRDVNTNVNGHHGSGEVTGTSQFRIRFNTEAGTFNMTIHRFGQTYRFEHVAIPYPFSYIFPMTPFRGEADNTEFLGGVITGKSFFSHPKCKVESRWIKTYDNSTVDLRIDECFHLLTGDCSSRKKFAVMVRKESQREDASKELKIYLGKTDIHMKAGSSRHSSKYSSAEVKVIVNGSEVQISKRRPYVIKDERNQYVAEVIESEDGVVILKSRHVEIKFNGKKIVVEPTRGSKGKLCGLCGEVSNQYNNLRRGPGACVYSKPELLAASFRIPLPSRPCEPLSAQVEEELETENRLCNRYEEIPTKVLRSFEHHAGKCTKHRHEVLDREDKICFSRLPVTECSARCRPASEEDMVEKKVGFACLPKNRVSEHYAEKVRQGKVLRELENLSKDFSVTMMLPRSCVSLTEADANGPFCKASGYRPELSSEYNKVAQEVASKIDEEVTSAGCLKMPLHIRRCTTSACAEVRAVAPGCHKAEVPKNYLFEARDFVKNSANNCHDASHPSPWDGFNVRIWMKK